MKRQSLIRQEIGILDTSVLQLTVTEENLTDELKAYLSQQLESISNLINTLDPENFNSYEEGHLRNTLYINKVFKVFEFIVKNYGHLLDNGEKHLQSVDALSAIVTECTSQCMRYHVPEYIKSGLSIYSRYNKLVLLDFTIQNSCFNWDLIPTKQENYETRRAKDISLYISDLLELARNTLKVDKRNNLVAEAKEAIAHFAVGAQYDEQINNLENNFEEVSHQELFSRIMEILEKDPGDLYKNDLYNVSYDLDTYTTQYPTAKYICGKNIIEIQDALCKLLMEHFCMCGCGCGGIHILRHPICKFSVKYESSSQLYSAVEFYPRVNFFKKRIGLKGLYLYDKPLTEELLELYLTFALEAVLRNINISTIEDDYHEPTTGKYLVDTVNSHVFSDILNLFPNNFFTSTAYKATILRAMKIAFDEDNHCETYNAACMQLVTQALNDCPDLTYEDFGLTAEIHHKVSTNNLTAKEAFGYASEYVFFTDEIASQYYKLLPESSYDKNGFHEPKFIVRNTLFEEDYNNRTSLSGILERAINSADHANLFTSKTKTVKNKSWLSRIFS